MKKCLLFACIMSAFTLLSNHVQAQNGANITWSCFSASASLANTTSGDVTYTFTSSNCSEAAGFSAEIVGTGALDIRSTISPQPFLRLQKTGTTPVFSYARFYSTSGGTFKLTGISVAPTSVGATAGGSQSITVHAYKSGSEVGTGVSTASLSSTSPVAVTLTSNFDNIDEIRLTSSSSTAFGIGVDNVTTATATTVSSLNRAGSTPSNGSTVNYTLTFGAAVTGVTASNFSLTTSGVSGAAVGTPTTGDSGVTWTIPVTTGSGDGNVTLNLANASSLSQAISTTLPYTGQTYSIDKTAPTISIGSPSASITKSGGVSYTVTYSDVNFSSSTLGAGNITVNTSGNASAGSVAVTGSGSTRTVTLSSITGDGTLGISIGSGTATDAAGNSAPASSASTTFTVDNTAPTVSIGSPSASLTTGGPVSYTVTYSDAHFNASTLGAGNITVNSTGGNASAGSISVTGSGSTRTVTLSSITGTGSLGISIPANTANDLAGNNAAAAGPSTTFAVDNTAPTVSSIALANTSPTNATSVDYTVTFSESVTGVDQSDFNLVGTGASGSITGFSGSGTSYTVTVSSVSGNGTLRLDLKSSGTGISDAAGNAIAAGFTGQSYSIDTTAPTVLSITQQDGSTTQNGSQIDYSVTFSEPVTGVDATDFVATTTGGVSQGTISLTPVSTTVYNVSITNITGDGTYRLDLKSSGTGITDAVGNAAGGFTTGDVFTIDNTAPTVASIVTASANPTNATSVDYTVTFSEAVTGVDKNDFTATNVSGSVSGTVSAVSGSGATYTVTVNSITGDGDLRLDLNSSGTGITDVANNAISGGFNTGQTYTIDNTAPTANTLVFASNHSGNQLIAAVGDVVSLSFTTNEPIQAPTVSIAGHSLTATNTSGNDWVASYTMTSGDTEGRIPFSLLFNDIVGNTSALYNDIGAGDDIEFDNTAPTISIGAPSQAGIGSGTGGTVTYTVTYADANFNSSTLSTGDITLNTTGASTATVAVSNAGTTSTVTLSNITGIGTLGISIAAGTASDAAGNLAPAAGPSTVFSVFSSDASLSSLTTSVDPLSPTFDTNTTSGYTASVPNATTTMTVTPTTTDSNVSDLEVRVNGGAPVFVASGTQSAALPLIAGSNTITIQVTAQDGTTTKTYTLTVNRAPSTNALLTHLKITPAAALTVVPGPHFLDYTASVYNPTSSISVTPTAQDAAATITVNGVPATSGVASAPVSLNTDTTTVYTTVTAADGVTKKTYAILVTRLPSKNALLTKLKITPQTGLTIVPGPDYVDYTASVFMPTSSISVIPTAQDAAATITVNGMPATSGVASTPVSLNTDTTTVYTTVTAADGTTRKTYAILVTRVPSNNALLSAIKITPAAALTVVPGVDYVDYKASVFMPTSSISVIPTAQDAWATITVNGMPATSGVASAPVSLNTDTTTIYTTVTAGDGTTRKTYAIKVTRVSSNNALLTAIKLTPATGLTIVSGTDYVDYKASVFMPTSSVRVTATAQDAAATITVNGMPATSGVASAPVSLNTDTTTVYTTVTAADGTTKKTYAILVTRVPSNNALLTAIKLTPNATLIVKPGTNYIDYETTVSNSTSSISLTATTQDATATLKVNGVTATSGVASGPVSLNADTTTVYTTVTAGDGTTKKTYAILVTRLAPPGVVMQYQPLESPITNTAIVVHQNVSPNGDGNSDALVIEGIAAHPDNKLQIMSRSGALVYEAKGYDNATKSFDGHSSTNGKLQQPGTYFYSLEYKDGNETKHKTGFIVLKY